MAGEWTTRKLADCCDFNPRSLKADWPHARLRYIDISSVGEGIQSEPFKLMLRTDAPSRAQRLVASGDSLLSTVRPNRRSMLWLGSVADNVVASTGFAVLRAKPAAMSSRYLYYTVFNRAFTDYLVTMEKGAAYPAVSVADIGDAEITLPPLAEQKAIAAVLGALDDKIELNRRMNATLEALSRALFQSWFVDFDPVRARLDPVSARPSLDPVTAALFPEYLEDSSLGLIPKGWAAGTLGDISINPRRGVQPGDIAPNTPYIALEHMPRRSIALSDWDDSADVASGKSAFKKGEILFGKLRPYFHKVGVAPFDGVCSTDILVLAPKSYEWFGFLLGHASSDELIKFTDLSSTGTKMPRTNWSDISSFKVALPPKPIAAAFARNFQPMLDRIRANLHQSRNLATLRDTLLPKLLSGKLSVDKIKEGLVA